MYSGTSCYELDAKCSETKVMFAIEMGVNAINLFQGCS